MIHVSINVLKKERTSDPTTMNNPSRNHPTIDLFRHYSMTLNHTLQNTSMPSFNTLLPNDLNHTNTNTNNISNQYNFLSNQTLTHPNTYVAFFALNFGYLFGEEKELA